VQDGKKRTTLSATAQRKERNPRIRHASLERGIFD